MIYERHWGWDERKGKKQKQHPYNLIKIALTNDRKALYKRIDQRVLEMMNQGLKEEVISLMERWWRTGEIYLEKPRLEDERNNLMHYFSEAFPEAVRLTD